MYSVLKGSCFINEAILEFRQTRLTKENIWLNIGYLHSEARIGHIREYFKPAFNCLYNKAQIGRIGECFGPARNCICSEVRIGCIGEYFKPVRNY